MSRWTRLLAVLVAAGAFLAGAAGAIVGISDDSGDVVFWVLFLCGGALLIVAGLYAFARSPWLGFALVAVGAIATSLALFWSVAVPIVAVALIALAARDARRLAADRSA